MKILLILLVVFCIVISQSTTAATATCESYEQRINRLQRLNARGGKAKQLEHRRQQINHHENELYKCRNSQKILLATNNNKNNVTSKQQKLRSINNQNPKLQQLIKTCNYWIEQYNENPSWHNANYRDTACRAADEGTAPTATPITTTHVKKLRDCIKSNNVIDEDVNECMKGNKEATWKSNSSLNSIDMMLQ